jgi:hypothetical protein
MHKPRNSAEWSYCTLRDSGNINFSVGNVATIFW